MFYEKFDFIGKENSAEYQTEDLIITYFLQQINSEAQLLLLIDEEWMHGLIDWCMDGIRVTTEEEDHWVLREIGFG